MEVNLLIQLLNTAATCNFRHCLSPIVSKLSTWDKAKVLAKTPHEFIISKFFTFVGGGVLTVSLVLRKLGHKLAEKEPLGLKYITAGPLPNNCTLPEYYMHLLAPHEYRHLSYSA